MIPYEFNAEQLSRWMAYVLRHNPQRYGLTPDRHGYVDLEALLQIARRRYQDVSPQRLHEFLQSAEAARFEVAGPLVRARYGHSIPVDPVGPPVEPPPRLYHGTEAARVASILADGLAPMDRRLLHLSATLEEAWAVAARKYERPAVVRVLAQEAHRNGVAFYRERNVYLASHIPPPFLVPDAAPSPAIEP